MTIFRSFRLERCMCVMFKRAYVFEVERVRVRESEGKGYDEG